MSDPASPSPRPDLAHPSAAVPSPLRRTVGTRHAVALYVGSVLGSGILVLPGLTAGIAGPASLLAWLALALASIPLAFTFATLSARRPESGGIYGFAREAFGGKVATITGCLFVLLVATGTPAVAMIAAGYLGYAFPLSRPETFVGGFAIIAVAYLINFWGVRLSSHVQLAVISAIVALLVVVIAFAGFHVSASNFQPFLPYGLLPVGTAAALIFWSFLGYENVSNVAEEFEDPKRDFPRSVLYSVVLVGVLYFLVAFVTVGTDAYAAGGGVAPFAAILGILVGPYAAAATALVAVFIIFGVVNAYTTGLSRVTYAVARDGGFPRTFAHVSETRRVPDHALALHFAIAMGVFVVYYLTDMDLTTALLIAGGAAIMLYIVGSAAGVRIHAREGTPGHRDSLLAVMALGISVVVVPFVGWPIFVSAVVVLVAVVFVFWLIPRNPPASVA